MKGKNKMTDYMAVGIAEGFHQALDQDQIVEAWQHLIDTGLAWKLQGWFGRTAQALIDEGTCDPPKGKVHCDA